jgi:hypothetical protein
MPKTYSCYTTSEQSMVSSVLSIARSCSEYNISKNIWPNKSMKELIMPPPPQKKKHHGTQKKLNIICHKLSTQQNISVGKMVLRN